MKLLPSYICENYFIKHEVRIPSLNKQFFYGSRIRPFLFSWLRSGQGEFCLDLCFQLLTLLHGAVKLFGQWENPYWVWTGTYSWISDKFFVELLETKSQNFSLMILDWCKKLDVKKIKYSLKFKYILKLHGTQLTLDSIGKDRVLEGSTTKIEDKQVPGTGKYIHWWDTSLRGYTIIPSYPSKQTPHFFPVFWVMESQTGNSPTKPWVLGFEQHMKCKRDNFVSPNENLEFRRQYCSFLENIVYHNCRQLWLVLGVKLMEISSNLFSRFL